MLIKLLVNMYVNMSDPKLIENIVNPKIDNGELLGEMVFGKAEIYAKSKDIKEPPKRKHDIDNSDSTKKLWYQKMYYRFSNEIQEFINKVNYHIDKFLRSITMSNLQIDKVKRRRRGEKINFQDEYNTFFENYSNNVQYYYYNDLYTYLIKYTYPICWLVVSIFIVYNPFLYEQYCKLLRTLYVFLPFYIVWYFINIFEDIKNMLILADKIIKISDQSQNYKEKTLYWIFGNYKVLYDYKLDHDNILKKYKEEINLKKSYDNLGPFEVLLLNSFRCYYNV
tara:strand:+ start:1181 stop:2020 length:840 start_codon:yes stop_codon:yes gene_type:complete